MGDLVWYILVYSFLGYLLEVCYARVVHGHGSGRKCLLLLPACPVYGVGAAVLAAGCTPHSHPLWVMAVGFVASTGVELLFGLYYKYVLQVTFWDYSRLRWNVGGLVCLPFSLAWSGLALGLVYTVHPIVKPWISAIAPVFTIPGWIVLAADCVVSSIALKREKNKVVLRWYRQE